MDNDLKKIKKLYGENMMHLCRDLFPTILEQEGLLPKLLTEHFAPSKFLYEDIKIVNNEESFQNYIYSFIDVENNFEINSPKTPKELLSEAGYDLYECHTEKDIQEFEKYYAPNEKLCTFNGGRLNSCHVFFAVKKNVDEIKRKDFPNPKREDEYGTSVISIQFSKGKVNTLSIKNRYNHTVSNPDATFSNNLENIIPGLTKSFEREYDLNINPNSKKQFELYNYVQDNTGKFYKYNYENNNIYYCPNNIIIDNFDVKKLEPEKYLLIDYFILDLHNKTIKLYDERIKDCFPDGIQDIVDINITKQNINDNKEVTLITKDNSKIFIELDKTNQIIGYKNPKITETKNAFLYRNFNLSNLELPSLTKVGNYFLYSNKNLKNLYLPLLEKTESCFMACNRHLEILDLPELTEVGDCFFESNICMANLNLPKLTKVGNEFLDKNTSLFEVAFPSLRLVGDKFMSGNALMHTMLIPKVEKIGHSFLFFNEKLTSLDVPFLTVVGDKFLPINECLTNLSAPQLTKVGDNFLQSNYVLNSIDLSSLVEVGNDFLFNNQELTSLSLPNLEKVGRCFLNNNTRLTTVDLPSLKELIPAFLSQNNNALKYLNLPSLDSNSKEYLYELFHLKEDDLHNSPIINSAKNIEPTNSKDFDLKESLCGSSKPKVKSKNTK